MSTNWAAFDVVAKVPAEETEKAREIAGIFNDTFSTDSGKRALEYMTKCWEDVGIVKGDDSQFSVGLREGRRDVVRQIKQQIRLAREGIHG